LRRLGVSFALLLGTVVAVHAADRITPTCDPNRVPSCWVEHGDRTGPQLVPVEPEQYDLPPPLLPPTALVPPPPGYLYAAAVGARAAPVAAVVAPAAPVFDLVELAALIRASVAG
jgi:hypothetical protein